MKVRYEHGICIEDNGSKVILDPTRQSEIGVVTHGHMDHLVKDAFMTHHTLDILGVRMGERRGMGISYGFPHPIGGFDVTLYPAGHVFGSAMVMVKDLLYTGDFNTEGGLTCGRAVPYNCKTLIIETTYGKDKFRLPSKDEVVEDIKTWTECQLEDGPVVFGAYEFGKAQEMISILNSLGEIPYVPEKVKVLCDVYCKHGVDLDYRTGEPEGRFTAVVPPSDLKKPTGNLVKRVRKERGSSAYLSGWCAFYSFFRSMDIDAQFPLSDHADYDELLDYVDKCDPEQVFTVHGSAKEFAKTITEETGIDAAPLKA